MAEDTPEAAPFAADWRLSGVVTHVFTHFELRLSVYRADLDAAPVIAEGWWEPIATLADQALPTVMKKAIAAAIPDAFKPKRKPHAR